MTAACLGPPGPTGPVQGGGPRDAGHTAHGPRGSGARASVALRAAGLGRGLAPGDGRRSGACGAPPGSEAAIGRGLVRSAAVPGWGGGGPASGPPLPRRLEEAHDPAGPAAYASHRVRRQAVAAVAGLHVGGGKPGEPAGELRVLGQQLLLIASRCRAGLPAAAAARRCRQDAAVGSAHLLAGAIALGHPSTKAQPGRAFPVARRQARTGAVAQPRGWSRQPGGGRACGATGAQGRRRRVGPQWERQRRSGRAPGTGHQRHRSTGLGSAPVALAGA